MNINDVSFDNFMQLSSKDRKCILNDIELLKVLVKKNISNKRYEHSLSVAKECCKLAKIHHVDVNKAYYAGILHDVCKFESGDIKKLINYLKYYDPNKLQYHEATYHSFIAKYYLKEKCNYHDKDVLNAIYNHTICRSKDKLSLILYIADKREPLRGINDNILQIAQKDLYKAYVLLTKAVEEYLKGKNERFIANSI